MQLFYAPEITEVDLSFNFDKEESKHIVKVLRKKIGDHLCLTNGKGYLFEAKLTIADIKHCSVAILSAKFQKKHNYNLHLAVAPTKMNDRYEWFLEKATELGIDEITPLICERSERKIVKLERFERIIQSAMKQSLQCYLPKLNAPMLMSDFLKKQHTGQNYIAHCEETRKKTLKSQLINGGNYTILIGPEGDFTSSEINTALQNKFVPVTLGNTRLRTETAAIAACHSVVYFNSL